MFLKRALLPFLNQMLLTKATLFLIVFLAFGPLVKSYAQDIITKKSGEQLKVKVIEIGTTEVKFKYFESLDGPTIVMLRSEIKTIKLEGKNGKSTTINEDKPDPLDASNATIINKTGALQFNFFSPLFQTLGFCYEQEIQPGLNGEVGLGIVGPGVGPSDYNPQGMYLRLGVKFLLGSVSDLDDGRAQKYAHPLKGRYVKIDLGMWDINTSQAYPDQTINNSNNNYSSGTYYPAYTVTANHVGIALMLIYGRQFILGNAFTFGYFIGAGYVGESTSYSTTAATLPPGTTLGYSDNNRFCIFTTESKTLPIGITGGINIGFLFESPKWLKRSNVSNRAPSRHSLQND